MTKRVEELRKLVVIRPSERDFIDLDEERCTACAMCVIVCPALLWRISRDKAVLAADYRKRCLECGGCYQICESGAIRFDYPPGGQGIAVSQG